MNETVKQKIEQDEDLEQQMSYKDYMKYKETNHLNRKGIVYKEVNLIHN